MKEQMEAVQRMQDYIEAHWRETVTLADMARASLFSPWYAHRLFTQLTGLTPADYLRKLRLSKSALWLLREGGRVADVAFQMGFGSVDGYQRAFLREFGCNPRAYAEHPTPLYLFTPYGVKFRHVERKDPMETVKSVFVQVTQKPARRAVVRRGTQAADYFAYCEEVGCEVWGLLTSIPGASGEPVGMWLPPALVRPGTSVYVQGTELPADWNGEVPGGCELIELPAARYLMFQSEPFAEEDYCAAIEQTWAAMEKYDPAVLGCAWDDTNPRIQPEPVGTRGYIELRAIREA